VSLQLNLYIQNLNSTATPPLPYYNRYYPLVKKDLIYPLLYTIQSTTATEVQAEKLIDGVYRRVQLFNTIFAVLLGGGAVALLLVIGWIYNERRRTSVGYAEL